MEKEVKSYQMATFIYTELVKWERMQNDKMGDKTLTISIFKSIKLHSLLYFFNLKAVGKYESEYRKYSLLLKLRIYLPISFTQQIKYFRHFF